MEPTAKINVGCVLVFLMRLKTAFFCSGAQLHLHCKNSWIIQSIGDYGVALRYNSILSIIAANVKSKIKLNKKITENSTSCRQPIPAGLFHEVFHNALKSFIWRLPSDWSIESPQKAAESRVKALITNQEHPKEEKWHNAHVKYKSWKIIAVIIYGC